MRLRPRRSRCASPRRHRAGGRASCSDGGGGSRAGRCCYSRRPVFSPDGFSTMLIASRNRLARLHYGPNGFRTLSPGDHVLCAVTGVMIGIDELGYWSVEGKEPYASDAVSTQGPLDDARRASRGERQEVEGGQGG